MPSLSRAVQWANTTRGEMERESATGQPLQRRRPSTPAYFVSRTIGTMSIALGRALHREAFAKRDGAVVDVGSEVEAIANRWSHRGVAGDGGIGQTGVARVDGVDRAITNASRDFRAAIGCGIRRAPDAREQWVAVDINDVDPEAADLGRAIRIAACVERLKPRIRLAAWGHGIREAMAAGCARHARIERVAARGREARVLSVRVRRKTAVADSPELRRGMVAAPGPILALVGRPRKSAGAHVGGVSVVVIAPLPVVRIFRRRTSLPNRARDDHDRKTGREHASGEARCHRVGKGWSRTKSSTASTARRKAVSSLPAVTREHLVQQSTDQALASERWRKRTGIEH